MVNSAGRLSKHLTDSMGGLGHGLMLHYQPILDLKVDRIVQWEGLVRWQHPKLGLLGAQRILDLIDQTNHRLNLLNWTLQSAFELMHKVPNLCIGVNMHSSLLADKEKTLSCITSALDRHGVEGKRLTIEITESEVCPTTRTAAVCFNEIKRLGVSIALDDFGSGYAGLGVLKNYNFDLIKIDRMFIGSFTTNRRTRNIIQAVLGLSEVLGIPVTAEGIETTSQLDLAKQMGFCRGQGFLIGRPMPEAVAAPLMASERDWLYSRSEPQHETIVLSKTL